MPLFAYKARSKVGEAVNGIMESLNIDAVASNLIDSGLTPVDIVPADKSSANAMTLEEIFPQKIKAGELIQFSRQMHSLLRAGVPILSALTGIANSTKNAAFRKIIDEIISSLEAGRDLATSMNQHENVFNMFYVSMIRIGETTGQLDQIFTQLSNYLERDQKTRLQIKKAIRYPGFVIIAITIAIIIINMFVIPVFAKMFTQFDGELPWMTTLLFTISEITTEYWLEIGFGMTVTVVGLRYYLSSIEGRYKWDKLKLKLPLIGSIVHRAILARFARLFAMASKAGVPLITSLNVLAHALDNSWIEEKVLGMQVGIERGDSISRTANSSGMFDSLVLQMITLGEESGSIDDLLEEIAAYYDAEVDYEVDKLASAIEPILTVVIGLIVLVLALGVFLPMWELSTIQTKRG